jgi:hypothetical protein
LSLSFLLLPHQADDLSIFLFRGSQNPLTDGLIPWFKREPTTSPSVTSRLLYLSSDLAEPIPRHKPSRYLLLYAIIINLRQLARSRLQASVRTIGNRLYREREETGGAGGKAAVGRVGRCPPAGRAGRCAALPRIGGGVAPPAPVSTYAARH